jgi:hypothetical protein
VQNCISKDILNPFWFSAQFDDKEMLFLPEICITMYARNQKKKSSKFDTNSCHHAHVVCLRARADLLWRNSCSDNYLFSGTKVRWQRFVTHLSWRQNFIFLGWFTGLTLPIEMLQDLTNLHGNLFSMIFIAISLKMIVPYVWVINFAYLKYSWFTINDWKLWDLRTMGIAKWFLTIVSSVGFLMF